MLQAKSLSLKITRPVPGQVEIDDSVHEQAVSRSPRLELVPRDAENEELGRHGTSSLLLDRCERHPFDIVIDSIAECDQHLFVAILNATLPRLLTCLVELNAAEELINRYRLFAKDF